MPESLFFVVCDSIGDFYELAYQEGYTCDEVILHAGG